MIKFSFVFLITIIYLPLNISAMTVPPLSQATQSYLLTCAVRNKKKPVKRVVFVIEKQQQKEKKKEETKLYLSVTYNKQPF